MDKIIKLRAAVVLIVLFFSQIACVSDAISIQKDCGLNGSAIVADESQKIKESLPSDVSENVLQTLSNSSTVNALNSYVSVDSDDPDAPLIRNFLLNTIADVYCELALAPEDEKVKKQDDFLDSMLESESLKKYVGEIVKETYRECVSNAVKKKSKAEILDILHDHSFKSRLKNSCQDLILNHYDERVNKIFKYDGKKVRFLGVKTVGTVRKAKIEYLGMFDRLRRRRFGYIPWNRDFYLEPFFQAKTLKKNIHHLGRPNQGRQKLGSMYGGGTNPVKLHERMKFPGREEYYIVTHVSRDNSFFQVVSPLGEKRYFQVFRDKKVIEVVEVEASEYPVVIKQKRFLMADDAYKMLRLPESLIASKGDSLIFSSYKRIASSKGVSKKIQANLKELYFLLCSRFNSEENLTVADIKAIHKELYNNVGSFERRLRFGILRGSSDYVSIGDDDYYVDLSSVEKAGDMQVRGEPMYYHFAADMVPNAISQWVDDLNCLDSNSRLSDISKLYQQFVLISPFDGDNCLIARILMDYALIKAGMPPLDCDVHESDFFMYKDGDCFDEDIKSIYHKYVSGRLPKPLEIIDDSLGVKIFKNEGAIIDPSAVKSGKLLVEIVEQISSSAFAQEKDYDLYRDVLITGMSILSAKEYVPFLKEEAFSLLSECELLLSRSMQKEFTWDNNVFSSFKRIVQRIPTLKNPNEDLFVDVFEGLTNEQIQLIVHGGYEGRYIDVQISGGCANQCLFCALNKSRGSIQHMPFPLVVKLLKKAASFRQTGLMGYWNSDPLQYHDRVINASFADVGFFAKKFGLRNISVVTHGDGGLLGEDNVREVLFDLDMPIDFSFHCVHQSVVNFAKAKIAGKSMDADVQRQILVDRYVERFYPVLKAAFENNILRAIRYFSCADINLKKAKTSKKGLGFAVSVLEEIDDLTHEVWTIVKKKIYQEIGLDLEDYRKNHDIHWEGAGAAMMRSLNVSDAASYAISDLFYQDDAERLSSSDYEMVVQYDGKVKLFLAESNDIRFRTVEELFSSDVLSARFRLFVDFLEVVASTVFSDSDDFFLRIHDLHGDYDSVLYKRMGAELKEYLEQKYILVQDEGLDKEVFVKAGQIAENGYDKHVANFYEILFSFFIDREELLSCIERKAYDEIYALLKDVPFPIQPMVQVKIGDGRVVPCTIELMDSYHPKYLKDINHPSRSLVVPGVNVFSSGKEDKKVAMAESKFQEAEVAAKKMLALIESESGIKDFNNDLISTEGENYFSGRVSEMSPITIICRKDYYSDLHRSITNSGLLKEAIFNGRVNFEALSWGEYKESIKSLANDPDENKIVLLPQPPSPKSSLRVNGIQYVVFDPDEPRHYYVFRALLKTLLVVKNASSSEVQNVLSIMGGFLYKNKNAFTINNTIVGEKLIKYISEKEKFKLIEKAA